MDKQKPQARYRDIRKWNDNVINITASEELKLWEKMKQENTYMKNYFDNQTTSRKQRPDQKCEVL